jgi:TonB family protein
LRLPTVIASVVLHVALAAGLIAVAQKRELRHRAISVAVTEEKKKAKPKPPAPPKPIAHPAIAKAAPAPKAAPVAAAAPRAAPVAMNLAMSNAAMDVGPGIGLEGRAPKAAAAPVKVASALSEKRTQRTREEAGEAGCQEEPTKPDVEVQTPAIDYTVYPQAQADGTEGMFRAQVVIDSDGSVSNVVIVKGIEPALDAAIVAALKRWRFKPAMACGKPVAGGVWKHQWKFELGD